MEKMALMPTDGGGGDYEAGSVEMAIIMRIMAVMRTAAIIKA